MEIAAQEPRIVNLKGSFAVDRASTLKNEIAEALASSDDVRLNLSLVEDFELACLQVLFAAKSTAEAEGKELHIQGSVPPTIAQRLVLCGFLRGVSGPAEAFESALVEY